CAATVAAAAGRAEAPGLTRPSSRRISPMAAEIAAPAASTSTPTRIPYAFARAHGVLAAGEEGGAIVVLTRPDATIEGIAEMKRVLQRPLTLRPVDGERFAAELARVYNAAS